MAEFPKLKDALHTWVDEAVGRLSDDSRARTSTIGSGHWQPTPYGVFKYTDGTREVWDQTAVHSLFGLPSWAAVLHVLRGDSRLNYQVYTEDGTDSDSRHIWATSIGERVLPCPNELEQTAESFEARYKGLERLLAAREIEYVVIWPLPGLTSDVLPVQLDSKLRLDEMSDWEFGYALDTELVRTPIPRASILVPKDVYRTCARYRYNLPVVTHNSDTAESIHRVREAQDEIRQIEPALKEAISIVMPDAVNVPGRIELPRQLESIPSVDGIESHLAGLGIYTHRDTLAQGSGLRRTQMNDDQASELERVWTFIRRPGWSQSHKDLALALRRLSYQAQREQPEDGLLDTMIAAEALYLRELGNATERGELRYRLALRAALWADPEQVGFTRHEVLKLMKSAYDARSAIAHGGTPDSKVMKVREQQVSLQELAETAKSVIVAGCRTALERADSGKGWPPDWDAMALGNS